MPPIPSPKSIVRKNSAGSDISRRRLNLIEGANITITVTDDPTNNEVDVTIAGSAGGGLSIGLAQAISAGYANTYITGLS